MHSFKYLLAALGGGLVGASVALLMAPASGQETRKRLSRRVEQEKKKLSKQIDRQKQVLIKKGRAALDDMSDYVADELQDAKKKIVRMAHL